MARILIVDDEEGLRDSIQFALASRHDALALGDGAEALEWIRGRARQGEAYDVILCDLMMPGMNGMELFERLRQELPAAAERMVFMSGGAVGAASQEFLAALPPGRVISKPFTLKELRAAVEERVERLSPRERSGS